MNELLYRLSLQFLSGVGPGSIRKLLQHFGNATSVFTEKHLAGPAGRKISLPQLTDEIRRRAEQEAAWMEKTGSRLCFYTDADFPKRLKNCADSPYMFYYRGENVFSMQKMVAVVGTRNISPYGKDITRKIVSELAEHDVCIVSGLARGVDAVAHEQAVESGLKTAAVMGSGLSIIYPDTNERLAHRIVAEGGALLSEFPFKTKPDRQNFPQRNRIIAGMADATLVMETANKGGSVITAHIAHSYNRDVFAVPGNIFSPTSEGCNTLIRTNVAALVTSGNDIAELMGWDLQPQPAVQRNLFVELSEKEKAVTELITAHPHIAIDDLTVSLPQFSPSQLASLLLQLELKGVIQCLPGKTFRMY